MEVSPKDGLSVWCSHSTLLGAGTLNVSSTLLFSFIPISLSAILSTRMFFFVKVVGHFSTSKVARKLAWRDENASCFWAVKLDVRDLGGHLVTQRAMGGTLSDRVKEVGFQHMLGMVCSKYLPV